MVDLLITADLGAAGNLVKNIVVQSTQVDFPYHEDRLRTVLRQYPTSLRNDKTAWLEFEYRLRNWKKFYGIDLSDHLDWKQYLAIHRDRSLPAVFLNHSAFYQISEFLEFYRNLSTILVIATNDWQLKWQVRAYVEKIGVENLHDFSFAFDKAKQIKKFIEDHGKEEYYRSNIVNMFEIMKERSIEITKYVDPSRILPLEWLIFPGHDDLLLQHIEKCFDINLPIDQANTILATWRKLHWDPEDTLDWKWWKQ